MALSQRTFVTRFACALLVGGFVGSASIAAQAQDVSASQIIKALTPAPVTRGLSGSSTPAISPADSAFVNSLRGRTRSLTVDEGDHVAKIAKAEDRPKIDLTINFGYNSAEISPQAESQLKELADALGSPELEGALIVLSGYTDAKGGAEYNQRLSQRRAEAVKSYLVDKFNVPAKQLDTVGYGKRDLKNPADPFGPENRRVQILNLASKNEAQR
jgi:outer membrane protein OmpA-like peptidoglycan-associated protein